jgi:3-hydroxyacyl-CoA dehydrogenase
MARINEVVDLTTEGGIAVITVDSPPVNALSLPVRGGLIEALRQADADAVKAIALLCGGRTYFAGFDIAEFDAGIKRPGLDEVIVAIERCSKPVVTGIHGTALGGGLETALGCHYRVAVPSAKLGLPEVLLGLLPGAGGTQRLPRIVGAAKALDMITNGRPIGGKEAAAAGIVDRLADEGSLRDETLAFAREVAAEGRPLPKVRNREDMIARDRDNPGLFEEFQKANAAKFKGLNAPLAIIEAVKAAVDLPFDQGLAEEYRLFQQLYGDDQSPALRYSFFAEREAAKIPGLPRDVTALPVRKVGIVGAGTMGGGIAMNFLSAGIPITIVEARQEALDRGVSTMRRNYEATAAKGRMSVADAERCMSLLAPSLSLQDLGDCDLVIEAVFENMDVKKSVFRDLDRIVRPGAILASNTSFLDLDAIADVTARPGSVVGLHFFSPANVMRMLEIVRGRCTEDAVLATAMKVARQIGKVAVVTGVCHGFIANRIFDKRQREAERLLIEGAMPWDVDRVAVAYGFPMGPFAMHDLVGLDVIGWDPKTTASRSVIEILNEASHHGQKSGKGYYDYDEKRRATPSPFAEDVIRRFAASQGIAQRTITDKEIADRTLYPMIREAVMILEEGIALRASDVDVAVQFGYGWPRHRGGPMFEADKIGAAELVRRFDELSSRFGAGYEPTPLMRRLAHEGGRFREVVSPARS